MSMQKSDRRCGDRQNCGIVIADCPSQAGHSTYHINVLSVLQEYIKIFAFCNMFSLILIPDALFLIAFIDKVGGVGKVD